MALIMTLFCNFAKGTILSLQGEQPIMYISFDNILPIALVAFAVAIVAMTWLLTVYRSRISLRADSLPADDTYRDTVSADDDTACTGSPMPPVSVIVYACDNSRRLAAMLPAVLGQRYNGEFDVIVVNDGSSEEVNDVIKLLSADNPNLHQTFVPVGARNLSRKKLAVSLGIKAARHDNIILTTAACTPVSDRWLALMARHFADGKEVVLGAATIGGLKSAMTRFDEVATLATWLSAARKGHPYRGTGWNLGYTRRLFVDAKGFSGSLNLHGGDDDLFVNHVATAGNTAVELSPDALMTVGSSRPANEARETKLHHVFTSRYLPKGPRRIMGLSTLMMWLWLAAMVTMLVFTIPNMIGVALLPVMAAALWIPLTMAWRRTAATLGVSLPAATLWLLMLWRWVPTLAARIECNGSDRANYTWQK